MVDRVWFGAEEPKVGASGWEPVSASKWDKEALRGMAVEHAVAARNTLLNYGIAARSMTCSMF